MKILMVLTSHNKLGDTGRKTGFWLEEFAAPYYTFLDAGAAVTLASPKGGQPPLDQGQSIVKGKRVTGFTNSEEEAVQLTKIVPFLVEDELKRLGGLYEKAADWASFVVTDGRLVTDQNPASSKAGAEALLKLLV